MFAEFAAAIQSVKTVTEIAKAATSLANYNDLVSAVSDVNMKLMETMNVALASQERQSALIQRLTDLEDESRKLKEQKSHVGRYKLHEFETGTLAYALKEEFCGGSEPMHYLCVTCVDKGSFTRLQPIRSHRALHCPECKSIRSVVTMPPRPSHTTSKSWVENY